MEEKKNKKAWVLICSIVLVGLLIVFYFVFFYNKKGTIKSRLNKYESFLISGFLSRDGCFDDKYYSSSKDINDGFVFTKDGNYFYQKAINDNLLISYSAGEEPYISEIGTWKISDNTLILESKVREFIKDKEYKFVNVSETQRLKIKGFNEKKSCLVFDTNSSENGGPIFSWSPREDKLCSYDKYDKSKMKMIANNGYNDEASYKTLDYDFYLISFEDKSLSSFYKGKITSSLDYDGKSYNIEEAKYYDNRLYLTRGGSGYSGDPVEELVAFDYSKGVMLKIENVESFYDNIYKKDGKYYNIDKDYNNKEIPVYEISETCYEGCSLDYLSKDRIIVIDNNGKFGIYNINTNVVEVEPKYEDLYDMNSDNHKNDNKYYKAKQNGKWNLYDLETNKQLTTKGYERIYVLNDKILMVYADKQFSFIDFNENLLTPEKIYADMKEDYVLNHFSHNFTGGPHLPDGVRYDINNGYVLILLVPNQDNWEPKYYSYNLKTNELVEESEESFCKKGFSGYGIIGCE